MTTGKAAPTKGARVRVDGLIYIVTAAEDPTELDEVTAVTEVEIQPAGPLPGIAPIEAQKV